MTGTTFPDFGIEARFQCLLRGFRVRHGISTVVGTIIFMGILLSTIIPMYLVMKQTDTFYFQKQTEMLLKDQDKQMEKVEFLKTVCWNSRYLNTTIKNIGSRLLNITYIGAYNSSEAPSYIRSPEVYAIGSQQNITIPMEFNYSIKDHVADGTYILQFITDTGNVFITKYPDKHNGSGDGEYGEFNATVTKIIGDFIPDYHSFSWAVRPDLMTSGFDWQQNWNVPGSVDSGNPLYLMARMNVTYYGAWKGNFTLSNKCGLYLLRTDPYDYTMPHSTMAAAFMYLVNSTGPYNGEVIHRYGGSSVTKVTQYREFTLYFGVSRVGVDPVSNGMFIGYNATYIPVLELFDSTGSYGQSFPLVAISTSGALDHFEFSQISSPQTTGEPIPVMITAVDKSGNIVTGYSGSNSLTDSTGSISPTVANFLHGEWSGPVTVIHAAIGVVISTSGGGKMGTSAGFNTLPTGFDHFAFSSISSPKTAGTPFDVSISAVDVNGNVVSSFEGAAILSVTAPGTINPGSTSGFSNGVWSGSITLTRSGEGLSITATDPVTGKSGSSEIFSVNAGALSSFTIIGYPTTVTSGQSFGSNNVVVRAYDFWGNIKTDYSGKVWFTSNDPQAVLPYYASNHAYTFTSGDSGTHTFAGTGFILRTKGTSIKVSATNGSVSVSSSNINVK
jgi:hypothetical protein